MGKSVVRGWLFTLLIITGFFIAAGHAAAAPYAAIVIDARTGEVLHSRDADRRLHPASLTKMMTVYLAIEAVKNGQLRLDQKVTVSRTAARQPPSKIGLRAGQRVTIRDMIRASAVKSANDASVVLAEAVSGSVEAFARLMTQKAHAFGMPNTTFRNPHGLTQRGHLSTARDMAVLGRRLFFDHPEYYNIFKRKKTRAAGRTIYATNRRFLSEYAGADGIKTGYTRAAGYNLVASARRGGKHIIAAVFGGRSSHSRNARMAELMDLGFRKAPRHAAVIPPRNAAAVTEVASAAPPPAKPPAPKSALERGMERIGEVIVAPAAAAEKLDLGPSITFMPLPRPDDLLPAVKAPKPSPLASAGWAVQIGAFSSPARARARLKAAADAVDLLAEADSVVAPKGGRLFRARFLGLSETEALAACATLARKGGDCAPLSPGQG